MGLTGLSPLGWELGVLKKFLLLLLVALDLIVASDISTDEFIANNSKHFELLSKQPSRVYASNPVLLYLLYALDPASISGINFEWNNYEKPYIKKRIQQEPVVGGFFGQGKIPNVEKLLQLNPDLILISATSKNINKTNEIFGKVKKPMLYLSGTSLEDYLVSWRVLGKILNKEKRASDLIAYAKQSLDLTKQLDKQIQTNNIKRPTIYYAQGIDGLSTECDGSMHAILIPLSGGEVVHKCETIRSRVKASFEQVLMRQPNMILVYEKEFYNKIYSDPQWRLLNAVKNKRVYLIPREPFSWFGKPPSFMRFLGIKWLIDKLHPQLFGFDMMKETREFYKLFLDLDLSNDQILHILGDQSPTTIAGD